MGAVDCIVIAVITLAVGGALAYIIKAKKNGKRCIGCPNASSCAKKENGCACCGGEPKDDRSE